MGLIAKIRYLLTDPRLRDVDYNSEELIGVHREILNEKKLMQNVFREFYKTCIRLDKKYFTGKGKRIEIGGGVSLFKKYYPFIISSDIVEDDELDMVIDAQQMDIANTSVRAIYGINCFHHFQEPDSFFNELMRVCQEGGGCILIEPHYGPIASWFYKRLFNTETYDKKQTGWNAPVSGSMVGANQALSYIVFKRDRHLFEQKYPSLKIVYNKPLNNYLRYFLSGGLNFRPLVPYFLWPLMKLFEILLFPLNRLFALHKIIIIRKETEKK